MKVICEVVFTSDAEMEGFITKNGQLGIAKEEVIKITIYHNFSSSQVKVICKINHKGSIDLANLVIVKW